MPVNLSIRNVPDEIADRLRARAKQNHRSLQGELMAIFQDAAQTTDALGMQEGPREYRTDASAPEKRKLTIQELYERAKKRAIYQPGDETSTQMIRRDRDEGH
jgi:plasmid stability protein